LQPTKAATPAQPRTSEAHAFDFARPNAVVDEKSSLDDGDINARRVAAVTSIVDQLRTGSERGEENVGDINISTGSEMIDQFRPWFFSVAFPFCFKSSLACPDLERRGRYRRGVDAPKIPIERWCELMVRRVEAQFRRDWTFTYTLWNYLFRTSVNLSRTIYSYGKGKDVDTTSMNCKDLEEAAVSICKAMKGKFTGPDGVQRKVNGDMTKLRYAIDTLTPAAQALINNIEHTTRKIPGTHEIRRKMRHMTHSYRVVYGQPLFLTMSPDEKHNAVMLKLARSRMTDPVHVRDPQSARWGGREEPRLDLSMSIGIDELRESLPTYDERRQILARDPLAAADGFRVICQVILEALFGMQFCPFCPGCSTFDFGDKPCQDLHGSNANPEGGIFGRADAFIGSIECQKAGSLHIHGQLFIQSLHQHLPMRQVFARIRQEGKALVDAYLKYKAHVCKQTYDSVETWTEEERNRVEAAWPTYADTYDMLVRGAYTAHSEEDGDAKWFQKFRAHVQTVQRHRQHHVHLPDAQGVRQPLACCRSKDKKNECKHGYPLEDRLFDDAVVVCPGIARARKIPRSGRRNEVGTMYGPRNEPNVNGTHPALLAGGGFNSDVQLPYVFPVHEATHSSHCTADCVGSIDEDEIIRAAQRTQDARIGYSCDYQNKRNPMCMHEIKEYQQGHRALNAKLSKDVRGYVGRRHAQRIMSDFYGKGIVRGAVECVNLLTHASHPDVTAAETIKTALCENFPGQVYLEAVESTPQQQQQRKCRVFPSIDKQNKKQPRFYAKHMDIFYGLRGAAPAVHTLSAYEFHRYWSIERARYPLSEEDTADCHARLTEAGKAKRLRRSQGADEEFVAGVDYVITEGDSNWIPFPDVIATTNFRHAFVMVKRRRPVVPSFEGCPMMKARRGHEQRNARIVSAYFRPWVLHAEDATSTVPYIGDLGGRDGGDCYMELQKWLASHVPSQELCRYITNFFSVNRTRPAGKAADSADERSDDLLEDEELRLDADHLFEALKTRIGGGGRGEEGDEGEADPSCDRSHFQNSVTAIRQAEQIWPAHSKEATYKRSTFRKFRAEHMDQYWKAARQSQQEDPLAANGRVPVAPRVEYKKPVDPAVVDAWLGHARKELNNDQMAVVEQVVQRVLEEEGIKTLRQRKASMPLLHCLHGGPGVGKSTVVLKLKEFFEKIMEWSIGTQFNIGSLQAIMACELGGETLHHIAGINPFNDYNKADGYVSSEHVSKRLLRTRWLIIDEISMVSANLLAQVEDKLRGAIQANGTYKIDEHGEVRPFGGLNVLYVGDFYQLDPPDGVSLASVPAWILEPKSKRISGRANAGLELFWGKAPWGVHGVTELTEPHRCKDAWYNEFVHQVRRMELSVENHAFLHGLETSVPGSWAGGKAECNNSKCQQLVEKWASEKEKSIPWEERQKAECPHCKEQRRTKKLVATATSDTRFQKKRFQTARTIVPNNDVKYELNKRRAREWAIAKKRPTLWSYARDKPNAEALACEPNLLEKKLEWLQRHDRECGSLYGMLPIVKGLPVALTDHIDRSPDKNLLRGRVGTIEGWILDDEDLGLAPSENVILKKQPKMVFVKFDRAEWQIAGLPKGVYPLKPIKRPWALDKNRAVPRLKIDRWQLPIAPAFAMTAHASQGQTLDSAIVDVCIGKESSPVTSYVALTRVRDRAGMLIYRPFDRQMFTRKRIYGPDVLLAHLRGDTIDWESLRCAMDLAIEKKKAVEQRKQEQTQLDGRSTANSQVQATQNRKRKYEEGELSKQQRCRGRKQEESTEKRHCRGECGEEKQAHAFTSSEWSQLRHPVSKQGRCKACMHRNREKKTCSGSCKRDLASDRYAPRQWRIGPERHCKACMREKAEKKTCSGSCKRDLASDRYSPRQWRRKPERRKCLACIENEKTTVRKEKRKMPQSDDEGDALCRRCIASESVCGPLHAEHYTCARCLENLSCSICVATRTEAGVFGDLGTFALGIAQLKKDGSIKCDACRRRKKYSTETEK
jgi:hypothetical protein